MMSLALSTIYLFEAAYPPDTKMPQQKVASVVVRVVIPPYSKFDFI